MITPHNHNNVNMVEFILVNVLVALDQLLNTLLGGWADETLSARAFREAPHHRRWAIARRAINMLFFWQPDHCRRAYKAERTRRQLPLEYRSKLSNPRTGEYSGPRP